MPDNDKRPTAKLRKRPQTPKSREQFAAIEAAARTVLQEIGRERFTTKDIIEKADVSVGVFYLYFRNREDVLDYIWPDRRDTFLPDDK